jgi:ABC-type phosphate transport system substrate-binding protein
MKRLLVFSLLLLMWPSVGAASDFRIIVNESNTVTELSSKNVADMLLKKTTKWADGIPVVPVDQIESDVRAKVSGEILKRGVTAIKNYWRQQVFGGFNVPPVEKRNDDEVIAFVRANRGAIGYVSANSPLNGIKVVVITQ